MTKVSIIDSGTSNLFSIANAFNKIGATTEITSNKSDIKNSDYLVLPGVGSFCQGMINLKKKKIN